jgi:putative MFS transporter
LIFAASGGLAVWMLRRRLPESPRWLAATGNTTEADRVVSAIEREVLAADQPAPAPAPPPRTADPLSTDRYRRRNLLMWIIQIIGPVGFYGFASIAPIASGPSR